MKQDRTIKAVNKREERVRQTGEMHCEVNWQEQQLNRKVFKGLMKKTTSLFYTWLCPSRLSLILCTKYAKSYISIYKSFVLVAWIMKCLQ